MATALWIPAGRPPVYAGMTGKDIMFVVERVPHFPAESQTPITGQLGYFATSPTPKWLSKKRSIVLYT